MATKTKLKAKQERFCQEYIKDGNGKQAAIRAGYSAKSATQMASSLLTFPNVKTRLAELRAKTESKSIMSAQEVLEELSLLGRTDMANFVTVQEDGTVRVNNFNALPVGASRCIRKIKQKTVRKVDPADPEGGPLQEVTTEFELWNKEVALDMLGRHRDLFKGKEDETAKLMGININFTAAKKEKA